MRAYRVFLLLALAAAYAAVVGDLHASEPALRVLPGEIVLDTVKSTQRVVVQRFDGDQALAEAQGVVWKSSDASIATVENGTVIPHANGTVTITAAAGEQTATAQVKISGQDQEFHWNFRNQILSIFSKANCNGGACHGALAGKKGFKLSLFGYDPPADYDAITRHARGRRVNFSEPAHSLLLLKPIGAQPHKGGVRFAADSPEFMAIAEWIADGAPQPQESDARLERLEILPAGSRQTPGNQQQLVVIAHYNDGRQEDVTRWAKFDSVNTSVAEVDASGHVSIVGPGEGAVKAWFLNENVLAFVSVPYPGESTAAAIAAAPKRNFIDEMILAKLESLNLPPSPPVDDAQFLRRAYLDAIGVLPTVEETRKFLADEDPNRRDKLIDALLERPEFVDYWAYQWSDLLLVSGDRLRPEAVKSYYGWIRGQVEKNRPWDEMVHELVTASGGTYEHGAANFYALHQDPTVMAETVAQAFLGLSINCAKCHNHPLEKWTNDQYYGMANLFSRVRGKGWGGDFRSGDGKRTVFTDTAGELVQPRTGKPQPPRPLDGEAVPFDATDDRREHLADWLTSPENPYFSRAIVNRVWANFFGVGLVEKVDDVRLTNPASNEALLAATQAYLVEHDFQLKDLMRTIMQSAAYQRSSESLPANSNDQRFYSHYYPRRLSAEVILDAYAAVTKSPSKFEGYDPGTRAMQLPDAAIQSDFLATFGRPERLITCDCERSDEPSMTQALHLYNGDTLLKKLGSEGSVSHELAKSEQSPQQIIEEAYLATLCRFPTAAETEALSAEFELLKGEDRRELVDDLFWSLLTSKEFLFNH
ncbi:DUF1553 domain-containing protein [Blastopirellula sp. JC732]|uniref:DUF1553 domain-containing protein n=1 Tax=Blastopirellula sediminis TaxID=2894196 RepID=A0A9X1SF06_9BACT|nr:DUF1549 domain-containing protein [Blastopirellula sediminis]MCC9607865.1 DUF1553 domain-containing protein [Blastopirellula sediminis]MCC9627342.1 DUF1553 domain-containing protein [Blastopirellula sediminis]